MPHSRRWSLPIPIFAKLRCWAISALTKAATVFIHVRSTRIFALSLCYLLSLGRSTLRKTNLAGNSGRWGHMSARTWETIWPAQNAASAFYPQFGLRRFPLCSPSSSHSASIRLSSISALKLNAYRPRGQDPSSRSGLAPCRSMTIFSPLPFRGRVWRKIVLPTRSI